MSWWSNWFGSSPAPTTTIQPIPVQSIFVPLPFAPWAGVVATTDRPSSACITLIEREEGLILASKPDVDGVYVLGYGDKIFNGQPVVKGQTCTAAAADQNCRAVAQQCATAVRNAVKVPITQGQLDALTDFVYNVGIGGFLSSTILHTLNANQPVIEDMFTRWNKITVNGVHVVDNGLTTRRKAEYQLFLS